MSRYFPDNQTPPEEHRSRPAWARGVALSPESAEAAPKTGARRDLKWLKSLAQEHTREAMDILLACARDESAAWRDRVAAVNALLDRGWGKPAQTLAGEGGGPIQLLTASAEALHARLVAIAADGTPSLPAPRDALGEGGPRGEGADT